MLDMGILFLIIFSAAVLIGVMSQTIFPPDNAVEEVSEEIVEEMTATDIDFSPSTPEK